MDLGTQIAAAGATLVADVTAGLIDVAPIALGVIAAFSVFGLLLRGFRKGTKG